MKSGTARGLKTLLWLGIVGFGAYWAWQNVLPVVARAVNAGGQLQPTPPGGATPTTQIAPTAAPTLDLGTGFADVLAAISKGFSSLGVSGAALDSGGLTFQPVSPAGGLTFQPAGVAPAYTPVVTPGVQTSYLAAETQAYLGAVKDWQGLTGYPTSPAVSAEVWETYYEEREQAAFHNI